MPRTGVRTGNDLAIELANWQSYEPGDVVIGTITRREQLVSPGARLIVRLQGRAKSKMIVKHQHGSSTYRGRFNFFDRNDTASTIFSGPLDIPPGKARSWDFAITIPTSATAVTVMGDNKETHSYLSLKKEQIETRPLPDIFYYKGSNFWSSTTFFGYVEYYLEAELISTTDKKKITTVATLPLFIRKPSTAAPLSANEFSFHKSSSTFQARSYRLDPDMRAGDLSFTQKARTAFGSSKVPVLEYAVDVACPTKIQMGTPIPFQIRVLPNLDSSTKNLQNTPASFRLRSLSLTLKATTAVRCSGTFSSHDQDHTEEHNFQLKNIFARLSKPVTLPAQPGDEYLDVGTMLQVLLEERCASALGTQTSSEFQKRICPSFTTYNVKHTHQLKWEMDVQVVGVEEWEHVGGETDVVVVAPSQQQMKQEMEDLEGTEKKKRYKELLEAAEIGIEGISLTMEIISAIAGT